jgi:hypothetical protein
MKIWILKLVDSQFKINTLKFLFFSLMILFVLYEKHDDGESVLGKNRPFIKSVNIFFNDESSYQNIDKFNGLSGVESWGRWVDGKHGQIKLKQSLYGTYKFNLLAGCFKLHNGNQMIVRIGGVQKSFVIESCDKTLYTFNLHIDSPQDYIEFTTNFYAKPSDFDSSNLDNRKLSISLYELKFDEDI